jgi:uncharacterized protein (TIGR02001 family)
MARTGLIIAAGALLAPPLSAAAAEWGGSVALSSNHLLRGVSRSSNDPSLSADLHAQGAGGWFAGLWAATSRVRPFDDTTVDLAATLGVGGTAGESWNWRASYSHYESPWQVQASRYRYNEITLDLQLGDVLLFTASWSPDSVAYSPYLGSQPRRDTFAYEVALQQQLAAGWRVHGGAGYHDLSQHFGEGYAYGSVGGGWSRGPWQFDLSYVHPGRAARRMSWLGTARRHALGRLVYLF